MDNKILRNVIFKFSGNIQATFGLVLEIQDTLNFDLGFNLESSNAFNRFANIVRNMIGRGLVQRPNKSGKNLILSERAVLELLVARKYLTAGCSMDCLSGYLPEKTIEELYDRLFTTQLPDVELVTQRKMDFKSSLITSIEQTHKNSPSHKQSPPRKLFYNIKIGTGLNLIAEHGRYSEEELSEMTDFLGKFVVSRVKVSHEASGKATEKDT